MQFLSFVPNDYVAILLLVVLSLPWDKRSTRKRQDLASQQVSSVSITWELVSNTKYCTPPGLMNQILHFNKIHECFLNKWGFERHCSWGFDISLGILVQFELPQQDSRGMINNYRDLFFQIWGLGIPQPILVPGEGLVCASRMAPWRLPPQKRETLFFIWEGEGKSSLPKALFVMLIIHS